ncbi:MAG: hypothetical protein JW795_07810 [Chitinivibrionales bacterium]|nr:hypothetical protein [Chitinivibrionales bacterium]
MPKDINNKYTSYHNRHSMRRTGYDYSQQGYYFITICIHNRIQRLFGYVENGRMVLNEMGNIAYNQFQCLPQRFSHIKLDTFQIMPNHVHAIIIVGATLAVALPNETQPPTDVVGHQAAVTVGTGATVPGTGVTVGTGATVPGNIAIGGIIGAYKSLVANKCLEIYKFHNKPMGKLWQRNYYDHIIRDETSLYYIRNYIQENPMRWGHDAENHINWEVNEFKMEEIGGIGKLSRNR